MSGKQAAVGPLSISHLPNELLDMILSIAYEHVGNIVSLTCRRWRYVTDDWRRRHKKSIPLIPYNAINSLALIEAAFASKLCFGGLPVAPELREQRFNITEMMKAVAKAGDLNALKYLMDQRSDARLSGEVIAAAVEHGHVNILNYLLANNYSFTDAEITAAAGKRGDLEMLQWLQTHNVIINETTAEAAAAAGHLQVLQWMDAQHIDFRNMNCSSAAANNRRDVVHWLWTHGVIFHASVCSMAARNGHLEMLKWLRSPAINCPWDRVTFKFGILGKHIAIVKYLVENNCPRWPQPCDLTAETNQVEMLQYLVSIACIPTLATFRLAVSVSSIEVMDWLLQHNFPCDFSEQIMEDALYANQLQSVKYLVAQGGTISNRMVELAAEIGDFPLIKYVIETTPFIPQALPAQLARADRLDILQWLHTLNVQFDGATMNGAIRGQHFNVIMWLRSVNCPWPADAVELGAAYDALIMQYLRDNPP